MLITVPSIREVFYFNLFLFYMTFFKNVAYLFVFDSVEAHDAFWSDIQFSIAEASSMKRSYEVTYTVS